MKLLPYIIGLFIIWATSCKSGSPKPIVGERKDTLLTGYLRMVDSLPYYDTNSTELKMLKAFSLNDTSTLKKLLETTRYINSKSNWELNLDSCVKQPVFEDIVCQEKYRFTYSQSFCPYVTSLTAIKQKDSIILNTVIHQYAWDTTPCKIISQSTMTIDSLTWEEFQGSLESADFWGLKPDNGKHGLDGSSLKVYGFKQSNSPNMVPDKSNFISRWSPARNAVFNCFIVLLRYSKVKNGCITVW